MLAELRAYEIPADWLRRAAQHCADRSGETTDEVLTRWAAGDPVISTHVWDRTVTDPKTGETYNWSDLTEEEGT